MSRRKFCYKMLCNTLFKLKHSQCLVRLISSSISQPVSNENVSESIQPRKLLFPPKYQKPRQVWLENLDTIDDKKLALLELHPDVFGTTPRIDIIHQNVRWQRNYRYVSFANALIKFECRGGGRKPWPQKGKYIKL